MVQYDGPCGLDRVRVAFDDERVVSDAGVALLATLADRLGVEGLANRLVRLRHDRPGATNAQGDGADLRNGARRRLHRRCRVAACRAHPTAAGRLAASPIDPGDVLACLHLGHVRQLEKLLGEALARAWRAGAGPGSGRLVIDIDSFIGEVHGYGKQGAAFGYTKRRGYHPLLACRADSGEVLHVRLRKGSAASSRGVVRFAEQLIARVAYAGASGEKLLRADSAFWNRKLIELLEDAGWTYSISVRMQFWVPEAIEAIPESAWQPLRWPDPRSGGPNLGGRASGTTPKMGRRR
jgi:Transposase DDE domain group 1